jgi:2-phosphoglycerate kinase
MHSAQLLIIINGATGVGKTTASSFLSRKLNCALLSTDDIRQKLRGALQPEQCPIIFRSSYEIDRNVAYTSEAVLTSYIAQADAIINEIGRHYLCAIKGCTILEGIHLNPGVLPLLANDDYAVIYLRMPSKLEHRRRLRERNLFDPVMDNKHRRYFEDIRTIGAYLDSNWTAHALNNKRIFLLDNWRDVDAIL